MIKSAVSSAARVPLAPARLAGRITGSLLRQLRGNGGGDARPASSARANASARSRAKARPKRAASGSRAKARPKRAATGTRAKARPKRAATGPRAKARPKRAARPKPLDDPAIARKVESTIFGDLDVDKREVNVNVDQGVVTLGGKVGTPDLIQELEARATRVTEVRRVENRLRVPERPASAHTDMPAPQPKTGRFQRQRPTDHTLASAETSEETAASAAADRTEAFAAAGQAQRDRATGGAMDSGSDRAQEAAEERAAHQATEERKAQEAAERGPAQEAVSEGGVITRRPGDPDAVDDDEDASGEGPTGEGR